MYSNILHIILSMILDFTSYTLSYFFCYIGRHARDTHHGCVGEGAEGNKKEEEREAEHNGDGGGSGPRIVVPGAAVPSSVGEGGRRGLTSVS